MFQTWQTLACLAVLFVAAPSQASPVVLSGPDDFLVGDELIDFDSLSGTTADPGNGLPAPDRIDDEYQPQGLTVSGGLFASDLVAGGTSSFAGPPASIVPNVNTAINFRPAGANGSTDPGAAPSVILLAFDTPMVRVGFWAVTGGSDNVFIELLQETGPGVYTPFDTPRVLEFETDGVASFVGVEDLDGFDAVRLTALDDLMEVDELDPQSLSTNDATFLRIDNLRFGATLIPEPSSVLLVLAGIACMVARRRRD